MRSAPSPPGGKDWQEGRSQKKEKVLLPEDVLKELTEVSIQAVNHIDWLYMWDSDKTGCATNEIVEKLSSVTIRCWDQMTNQQQVDFYLNNEPLRYYLGCMLTELQNSEIMIRL